MEVGHGQELGLAAEPSRPSGRDTKLAVLHEAFAKCLDYGLKTPTLQDFHKNFPGLAPAVVDALYDTYKQVLALVRYNCQAEFQDICREYGVEQFLGVLDECAAAHISDELLEAMAQSSRPSDSAAAVQSAESSARMQVLNEEAERLQDLLDKASTQQERLRDALSMRQGQVDKLLGSYATSVTDVKQVYDITKAWPSATDMVE